MSRIKNTFVVPQPPAGGPPKTDALLNQLESAVKNLLGSDGFGALEKIIAPLARELGLPQPAPVQQRPLGFEADSPSVGGKGTAGEPDKNRPDPDLFPAGSGDPEQGKIFGNFTGTDPEALQHILDVATREGDRSAVGGSWKSMGPSSTTFTINDDPAHPFSKKNSGRPTNIVPDPKHPGTMYLSSSDGGVWKTTDNGKTWKAITDKVQSLAVGSFAMDPKDTDTLYLGFGDPFSQSMPGLIKSTDGGRHWSKTPVVLSGTYAGETKPVTATQTRDLKVSSDSSNVVLAATNAGLFRSTDAGKSFQLVTLPSVPGGPLPHEKYAWSVAQVSPHTWLCSSRDAKGVGGMYRSTDDGATWSRVSLGADEGKVGRMTIATGPDGRAYVLAGDLTGRSQQDVLRSDDGGQTWSSLGVNASGKPVNPNNDNPDLNIMAGQAFYNQMISVDPNNPDNVIIGGQLGTARSNDGGKTWAIASNWLPPANGMDQGFYVHADAHAGAFANVNGKTEVLVGTDGGIFATDEQSLFNGAPGAAQWDDSMNAGLDDMLMRSVGTNWNTEDVIGGLQDNGTQMGGGTKNFTQVVGGDGWGVSEGSDPNVLMASVNGQHLRSIDGGKNWDLAETGLPGLNDPFDVRYAALADDPSGKSFLTVGNVAGDPNANPPTADVGGIFRTSDAGGSWSSVVGSVKTADGQTLTSIPSSLVDVGADRKNPGVWGALGVDGRAYVTNDGGKNWTQSQPVALPGQQPSQSTLLNSIAFDSSDPTGKTFFVTRTGSEAPGSSPAYVFKTTDGGQTWTGVTSASGAHTLPDVPSNVVRVDPSNPKTVYVGNVLGVYRSLDGGQTWDRFGKNLPMVPVTDIQVKPDGSALRIATYGRGFWELSTQG